MKRKNLLYLFLFSIVEVALANWLLQFEVYFGKYLSNLVLLAVLAISIALIYLTIKVQDYRFQVITISINIWSCIVILGWYYGAIYYRSEYSGIVVKKYIDSSNHSSRRIILRDKSNEMVVSAWEIYESVVIGDTVKKEPNSKIQKVITKSK